MLQKLQWDSLQQCRARSRVLMLYRIRNGLVSQLAIPALIYLQPTVVHTTGFYTSYIQTQCNTSMYTALFLSATVRLPVEHHYCCSVLPTSTAHTCAYTAVRYCSMTDLAPLLDEYSHPNYNVRSLSPCRCYERPRVSGFIKFRYSML